MKSRNQLGLFAKYWQPGKVKTRLAATIGAPVACEVYQEFLSHLLLRLKACGDSRTVVFSPPEKRNEFYHLCGDDWSLKEQSAGNLGTRLQGYFEQELQDAGKGGYAGERKVVVIGSDCPLINPGLIETAFDSLGENSVVIGPSQDGGYYLIGMRDECPAVFEGIEWSSESVLEQTVERLVRLETQFALLEQMRDVDEWNDLVELMRELEQRNGDNRESSGRSSLLVQLKGILTSYTGEERA